MRSRNAFVLVALAAIVFLHAGCVTKTFKVDTSKAPMVSLADLSTGRYSELLRKRQRVVISLKKGERIPVDLILDTKIASLKSREQLTVLMDLCIYISKKTVAVSPDCRTFAPISKGSAVKKLFGLGRSSVSVGLSVGKQGVIIPVQVRSR